MSLKRARRADQFVARANGLPVSSRAPLRAHVLPSGECLISLVLPRELVERVEAQPSPESESDTRSGRVRELLDEALTARELGRGRR
jgi:hypothetical protein